MRTNEFGQAIGDALPDFTPGRLPAIERIEEIGGASCRERV